MLNFNKKLFRTKRLNIAVRGQTVSSDASNNGYLGYFTGAPCGKSLLLWGGTLPPILYDSAAVLYQSLYFYIKGVLSHTSFRAARVRYSARMYYPWWQNMSSVLHRTDCYSYIGFCTHLLDYYLNISCSFNSLNILIREKFPLACAVAYCRVLCRGAAWRCVTVSAVPWWLVELWRPSRQGLDSRLSVLPSTVCLIIP